MYTLFSCLLAGSIVLENSKVSLIFPACKWFVFMYEEDARRINNSLASKFNQRICILVLRLLCQFFLEHTMFFWSRELAISELGGSFLLIFFLSHLFYFLTQTYQFPFAVIIFELHNYYLLMFKSLSFPFTPTDSFKPLFYAIISGFVCVYPLPPISNLFITGVTILFGPPIYILDSGISFFLSRCIALSSCLKCPFHGTHALLSSL